MVDDEGPELFDCCEIGLHATFRCVDHEPDDYVDSLFLALDRVVDYEGEEIEPEAVARMVVWRVRLRDACDAGEPLADVFDAHSDWLLSYLQPLDKHTETFEEISDLFVIQDLAVNPRYRGYGLGVPFLRRVIRLLAGDCDYALCEPRARTTSDFIPEEWMETKLSDSDVCLYFERAGFRSVEGTEVYRLNLYELDAVLHDEA